MSQQAPGASGAGSGLAAPCQLHTFAPVCNISTHPAKRSFLMVQGQEPGWRYVDMYGNIQGPFPASHMRGWYLHNRLTHNLPVCGTVRPLQHLPCA